MSLHVQTPPTRPLLIYDGDCGFCKFWVERWRVSTGARVEYRAAQEVGADFPAISKSAFENAVQFIETDGRVFSGADAVFHALEKYAPQRGWWVSLARKLPGFLATARVAYRFIARHRPAFSIISELLFGRIPIRSTYLIARSVFLRLLGCCYLAAFASLGVQVAGLIGERGIVPAREFLQLVGSNLGPDRYTAVPTLFWFNASDAMLSGTCLAGAAISIVLIAGYWPAFCLLLLWMLYLSLMSVGGPFLSFQWDALLLEAGFLAIFLVPPTFRPSRTAEPFTSRIGRWLLLWLLFRLMFESAVVKLTSQDLTWRNLTALDYHYWTQPLPIWTSWYANQAPGWVHKGSALGMFLIEFGAPLLILAPRNLRRVAVAAMIALQMGIGLTGNYCFFNLLSIALAVLLLDDGAWPAWLRSRFIPAADRERPGLAWPIWVVAPVAIMSVTITGMLLLNVCGVPPSRSGPLWSVYRKVAPFRSMNSYGLFAIMTTSRPEIVIEGSRDGVMWTPYEFQWKPGDVNRRPRWVQPHQPRLDWQMWFAALGTPRGHPWFEALLARLLTGSPEVLALFAVNPFPEAPPKFIRAVLYEYEFTTRADPSDAWWKRDRRGLYFPPVSLSPAEQLR